jgi:large subunit ribosomal protein L21
MYAVIETGGKQYRVEVGTELAVDLLDAEPGQAITFDRVLLVGDGDATSVGQPTVANAAVEAEVVRRDRGEKLIVFKYRPKARTRVKKGHRQDHLVLRITDVKVSGRSAAEETRKAQDDARTERQRLEEAAARQAAADAELAARLAQRSDATEEEASPKPRRASRAKATEPVGDDASASPTETPDATSSATAPRTSRKRSSAAAPDAPTVEATADADAESTTPATESTASESTTEGTSDEPAPERGRDGKDG